jgi:PAS domain S-box-containing protein
MELAAESQIDLFGLCCYLLALLDLRDTLSEDYGSGSTQVRVILGAILNMSPAPTTEFFSLFSENGLKAILNGIGEGFYAVDDQWRILLFNNEAAEHFKRRAEEVLGRNLWETFPGARDTDLGALFVQTMQSRETIRSEAESVIFAGRWLAYRLFPLGSGMGVVFRDITDRRSAEAQRDLLMKELEHRIKNTLTLVQSIADQTFRNANVDPEVQQSFAGRLISLGNIHSVLTQRSWSSAELHETIISALGPYNSLGREVFGVRGPSLRLTPRAAVSLSMAIHELCTNAVKYGALSVSTGRVEITWTLGASMLSWTWREQSGPTVVPPVRTGFGSRLIAQFLAAQLNAHVKIDYKPSGVVCSISAPLSALIEN